MFMEWPGACTLFFEEYNPHSLLKAFTSRAKYCSTNPTPNNCAVVNIGQKNAS